MDIKYSLHSNITRTLFAILAFYMYASHFDVYATQQGQNIDSNIVLEQTLPSIVIIDSERIAYNSPYKNNNLKDFFYPLDIDIFSSSPQGNGIEHKNIFGSGIIYKNKNNTYYILSNSHVIEDSSSIWITTHDGLIHAGTLIGSDKVRDIALLSFTSNERYPLIPIGDYEHLKVGSRVYAIGVPFGFTYTVTEGIISSLDKTDSTLKNLFIQTDASMNPGNSGGALIDATGKLIGINTWIYSPKGSSSIGINFASSINIALEVADTLIEGKQVRHAWIGIVYEVFAPFELNRMGYEYRLGAIVSNIVKESPSYSSKLKIGDMIIEVNSNKIQSFNADLSNATAIINTLDINKTSQFKVLRNGKIIDLTIIPQELPVLESKRAMAEFSKNIWPGITVLPLEEYKQELLGLNDTEGFFLYVDQVIPNSIADESHFQEHDVIVKINNKVIRSYKNYIDIVNRSLEKNTDIVFTIFENGHISEKTLKQ